MTAGVATLGQVALQTVVDNANGGLFLQRFCVLLAGAAHGDGRVVKVVTALATSASVDLFSYESSDTGTCPFPPGVRCHHVKQPRGPFTRLLTHSLFFLADFRLARSAANSASSFDAIYCNDLPTLAPGWWLKRGTNARLIYDSHEIFVETLNQFFFGAAARRWRARTALSLMQRTGRFAERRLLARIDSLITVNHSLAEYFRRFYGYAKPVHVVMNCPSEALHDGERQDLRQEFGWRPEDVIAIYQGVLNPGRGLGVMLEAIARLPSRFKLVIFGDGPSRAGLERQALDLEITDRVRFIRHVAQAQLLTYTRGADVGINLLEPLNLSKQLTSASKLFEYLAAGIPSICSRVPETERIFQRYNVGVLTEVEPAAVARALESMADESSRRVFRSQALVARRELTWELQLPVLLSGVGLTNTATLTASDR